MVHQVLKQIKLTCIRDCVKRNIKKKCNLRSFRSFVIINSLSLVFKLHGVSFPFKFMAKYEVKCCGLKVISTMKY